MDFKKIFDKKLIIIWAILFIIILLAFEFKLDKKIITSIVLIYGMITPIFTIVSAWIVAIPFLGPLIIKLILLPITWLLNGVAYLSSIIFVAKGETKKAMDARLLSTFFFIGFLAGYIVGKIF